MRHLGLPIGPAVIVLVLVLLLLAAAGFLAGCGSPTLNAYDVRLEAASVKATAAEAALVARGAWQAQSTAPFVKVRAMELAQRAGKEAELLRYAQAPPGLSGRLHELARLSDATATGLARLAAFPHDRGAAADVWRRCAQAALKAGGLSH